VLQCHGVQLLPCQPEEADEKHRTSIERDADEFFVRIDHEMTKKHYITFIAAISGDRLQLTKLYPEGSAEARFKINGVRNVLYYCNRDGLFQQKV